MIARASSGWQTMLADLSLILFMITAAKVSESSAKPNLAPPPTPPPLVLPALSQPVAVWQAGPEGADLNAWLAQNAADPRLRVTIIAPATEVEAALALSKNVRRSARILLEPGVSGAPMVTLTYDQAATPGQVGVARSLRQPAVKENLP